MTPVTYKVWDADTSRLVATVEGERLARVVLTDLLGSDLGADDVLNAVTPNSLALGYGGYTVIAEGTVCSDCGAEVGPLTDGRCSDCDRVYGLALHAAREAWEESGLVPVPDRAEAVAFRSEGDLVGYFVTGYKNGKAALVANVVIDGPTSVTVDDHDVAAGFTEEDDD